MYVSEATMHFVVNTGLNIAEAINFGTSASTIKPDITFCNCKESDIGRMRRQKFVFKMISKNKIKEAKKLHSPATGMAAIKFLCTRDLMMSMYLRYMVCFQYHVELVNVGRHSDQDKVKAHTSKQIIVSQRSSQSEKLNALRQDVKEALLVLQI